VKRVKDSGGSISGVNIAPVIDVALVLVIVMMMTGTFLNIPNMPVNLPEAVTTETKENNVAVSLGMDGAVSVNADRVDWNALPAALNARLKKEKNLLVIIRADKDVPYARVEALIDVIKNHTLAKRLAVATQQRPPRGPAS
jgi:biopolymer transport protein ExbD